MTDSNKFRDRNITNCGNGHIIGDCFTGDKIVNITMTHNHPEQPLSGLGQRLNKAMKAKGVSPYKLEQNLGISRFLLCEYLNNTKEPTLSNIIILADYLNISLDWLIRGEDCIIHR